MNKTPRIAIGLGCAFVVALIAEVLGLKTSWVGFASALFIWTIMTESDGVAAPPRKERTP